MKTYHYKGEQWTIKKHARFRIVLQKPDGSLLIVARNTFLKKGGYTT